MRDIIFTFFNYFVFFYTSMLAIFFVTFAFLSFISLKRRKDYYVESYMRKTIKESPYTPGISVIAPAFNEEKTIIDNVNSMLALEYPLFEVVIVNDGSTDSTLEKMTEYYELVEVPYAYIERIKTKPFRRLFKSTSPKYSRLIVVDKENGGTKADASNAGINVASHPYFICTDVDCILEKYALYRCISPIISSEKQVIAVSGTMLMANGCVVKDGQIIDVRTPRTPIPLFQNLEYMRSYLIGKMGWSAINGMPNVSGGFGLFDRSVAIAAGGYDAPSFAEDMDMLIRMVGYCCDFGRKYRVVQIPANCCWTEVPPTLKVLYRQRVRWGHGLIQTFVRHRRFLFNWKYRQLGMVTLPYVLIFECLAPVIEFFGLLTFLYQALTGVVNWKTAVVIFFGLYAFCISLSLIVLFYDYSLGGSFRKVKSYLWIIGAAILEPFLYHPLIVVFSIKGYCNFLLNKKAVWGEMSRKGFAGSKKKEKSGEREKGGES